MIGSVRAKFKVAKLTSQGDGVLVELHAVTADDLNPENRAFADATQSGTLTLSILGKYDPETRTVSRRPAAKFFIDAFEKSMYLDFTVAE